ncbi:probable serine/threonine-protein kinase DDB_G0276461 isoform X1 [Asparagus officinalis]|nr:probable serine/threonine-protein kinase DDB_G0276461 isoform X1 [Asparagus officinalis]XP_020268091.1 probable serine/threonine-protein kinase DDB_G0276461 isoform X1 [Asparagus officinalis]XP_020268092.1 probable serine/threonine-protein kinase DDB_G0276461 isoform X1 [Asparagus officinalis]
MWKLNPFTTPREPTTLEGRYVTVGNKKTYVRNAIAEGGFSCVYLAHDAVDTSKQYALKHIVCNDGESLESVVKEVSVMKMLKDHPNVVALVAHTILDMGRTKEALLLLEFCDQTLVTMLEKRGAAYFEEKQILSIFRDICNAVFAMHRQSPPIAHRDLKAENVLLGSDGAWKVCDFGSTSTNHRCFDRPEERGVEEDNIRKHTTPAYRAPEMWDLYRKEVISEKVDIWALGCLLFRICYLKSAFDGESKLQILNGNFHIPEIPNYSPSIKQLIKDMLHDSPDGRPDIMQVWFRVNEQLPSDLRKRLPDGPATDFRPYTAKLHAEGVAKKTMMNQKTNPPKQNTAPQSQGRKAGGIGGNPTLAVRTSHHAKDKDAAILTNKANTQIGSYKIPNSNPSGVMTKAIPQNESCNTFVADFDHVKVIVNKNANTSTSAMGQDAEVNNLKEQLKEANLEKVEITLKYEKVCAICRSQRQEIQELKQALAAGTPSPQSTKNRSNTQISPSNLDLVPLQREKMDRGIWELEQAMFTNAHASPSPCPQQWEAFTEEPEAQPSSHSNQWSTKAQQNIIKQSASTPNISGAFGLDRDLSFPSPSSNMSKTTNQGNNSQLFGSSDATKTGTDTPLGWANF